MTECFRAHWIDITPGNNYSRTDWTPKYKTEEGRCFSYEVPRHLHELKVTTITLYLTTSVYFYLHHPGQLLTWNTYGVSGHLGEYVELDVIHEVN